jgi:hypothetical protein
MPQRQVKKVWLKPLILAVTIIFGLLSALLGTGWWYYLAWATMATPLFVIFRALF